MVYPLAIALMGAGVRRKANQDEIDAKDQAEERAARQEERAYLRGERDYVAKERARMGANRDRVAAAAAPVVPTDGTVYQPEVDDEGNAMPANPTAGSFMVDGKRFADRGDADTAADGVRRARISTAMEQGNDFQGAQRYRTEAMQERTAERQGKLADLQLSEATLASERDRGLREAGKLILAGGWSSVPKVYEKYRDGLKAEVKENGHGGATVTYASPDGKVVGSKSYTALPEFFADVAGGFDPNKWFDYQNNQADKKRVQSNWEKDYKLREGEASRRATHEARMLSVAERGAAGAGANAGQAQVGLKDMREFQSDMLKLLESEFDPRNAVNDAERAKTIAAKTEAASMGSGIFLINARMGVPVTAAEARQAQRLWADPSRRQETPPQSDGMVYPVTVVNGRWVVMGPGKPPKAATPAQPAASPAAASIAKAPPGSVSMQGGRYAAGGQGAPAAVAPQAQAGQASPLDQAYAEAEVAKSKKVAAAQKHNSYGLRQRANDPAGYAKAEAELRVAEQVSQAAEQKYRALAEATSAPRVTMLPSP